MFYVMHMLIGMLIGLTISSPTLIALLAFLSHFVLDYIPHWDGFFDKDYFELTGHAKITKRDIITNAIDLILMIVILLLFYFISYKVGFVFNKTNLILGVFMSLLPDILKIGYLTRLNKKSIYVKYLNFHSKIQKDVNWKIGLIIQSILFIIFLVLIIWLM